MLSRWCRWAASFSLILNIAQAKAGGADSPAGEVHQGGRGVYQEHCAACHGATAEGAIDWRRLNKQGEIPAPPHDATGHTWRHSDAMLRQMIQDGWRDPFNKTKHLTMPAFGAALSPDEIQSVITYLKTLWTPKQRRFQQRQNLPSPKRRSN